MNTFKRCHKSLFSFSALLILTLNQANAEKFNPDLATAVKNDPFYLGFTVGRGSTNWSGMVDKHAITDDSDLSVPVRAEDTGFVWGGMAGYEFSPLFAVEFNYRHYSTSELHFDDMNQYFETAQNMPSRTQSINLVAKVMVPIFRTGFRFYSELGPAYTYRRDVLANTGHMAAAFGGGFNLNITTHLMTQIGFNYTTGYGKSETAPVKDYFPFLYSVDFSLAARF